MWTMSGMNFKPYSLSDEYMIGGIDATPAGAHNRRKWCISTIEDTRVPYLSAGQPYDNGSRSHQHDQNSATETFGVIVHSAN